MVSRFRIGVITAPHGVHGDVKVYATTEDIRRFKQLKSVYLAKEGADPNGEMRPLAISHVRFQGDYVILHPEGYDSPEAARALRRMELFVDRSDAIRLPEGSWFLPDLIGMQVFSLEGEKIGTLTDVIETGANDVFEVQKEDGKELLLPNIPDCIREVDVENARMTVYVLPGLEDL